MELHFVYFGLTIPPFVLLISILGQCRLFSTLPGKQEAPIALGIVFLIWFPLMSFLVFRMNVYDGVRHFLFIIPALAVAAGAGAAWLVTLFPPAWGVLRESGVAALLAAALPSAIALHPYEYVYYNIFAGPRDNLHERYETDYWATGYREAARWIGDRGVKNPNVILAANGFSKPAFVHFAGSDVQIMSQIGDHKDSAWPEGADYYVATVRYGQHRNYSVAPVVYRIEKGGILLAVIRSVGTK